MKKLHIINDDNLRTFNEYINAKAEKGEVLKKITSVFLEFELKQSYIDTSKEELRVIKVPTDDIEVEKLKSEMEKHGLEVVFMQKSYWIIRGKKNSTEHLQLESLGYSDKIKKKSIGDLIHWIIGIMMIAVGISYAIEYATNYLFGMLNIILIILVGIFCLIDIVFLGSSRRCNDEIKCYEVKSRREAAIGILLVLMWAFVVGTWLRAMADF